MSKDETIKRLDELRERALGDELGELDFDFQVGLAYPALRAALAERDRAIEALRGALKPIANLRNEFQLTAALIARVERALAETGQKGRE